MISIIAFVHIVQAVLGLFFLFTGTVILSGKMANEFKRFGLPSIFNSLTGSIEILGAIGMAAGFWFPITAIVSGLLLGSTMLVAAFILVVIARDPIQKAIPAVILSVLTYMVAIYML